MEEAPSNNALKLTAPLGGRSDVGSTAAASRPPSGGRRRRSLARC